jgi:hypothetical protein
VMYAETGDEGRLSGGARRDRRDFTNHAAGPMIVVSVQTSNGRGGNKTRLALVSIVKFWRQGEIG